jgi:hypothetical protein
VALRGRLGRGKSYIISRREILNVGFGELIFPGGNQEDPKSTVPGQSFFSLFCFQMRNFFIHSKIVQAA